MLDPGNISTVYVVFVDESKDLSDAKRFGKLRGVFTNKRKPYNTHRMVEHARDILRDWQPGDYLLFMGDPALCAVCMTLVAEFDDVVSVLQWDRLLFQYVPETWNFSEMNSVSKSL